MLRLSWSKDALSYLRANQGEINTLELAFADFRRSHDGIPKEGMFIEIVDDIYLWTIHDHMVLMKLIHDDEMLHMRIDDIQPIENI